LMTLHCVNPMNTFVAVRGAATCHFSGGWQ
jgi:hypothetical protein